jgi:flagellar motor switch protein FliN/FliY
MSRQDGRSASLGQSRLSFARSRGAFFGVSQVNQVDVEIQIVLGRATLPMAQLLRMGRGAVIPLDANVNEEVWILANNHPIARGEIQINDDRISIAVTRAANVYDYIAGAL